MVGLIVGPASPGTLVQRDLAIDVQLVRASIECPSVEERVLVVTFRHLAERELEHAFC